MPRLFGDMIEIARRIRQRLEDLGLKQVDVAHASGMSAARLGNYISLSEKNNRTPDVKALKRLAIALNTTSDWLLGISERQRIDIEAGLQRLLEIDGMPQAKAKTLAQVFARALVVLSASADEGDARARSLLAVELAWQMRDQTRPL